MQTYQAKLDGDTRFSPVEAASPALAAHEVAALIWLDREREDPERQREELLVIVDDHGRFRVSWGAWVERDGEEISR